MLLQKQKNDELNKSIENNCKEKEYKDEEQEKKIWKKEKKL